MSTDEQFSRSLNTDVEKPVSNSFMPLVKPTHCKRCGRPFVSSDKDSGLWNVDMVAGAVRGYICPGCQTADESAEAEVNQIEMENARLGTLTPAELRAMSREEKSELFLQTIEDRCRNLIRAKKEAAEMAGDTQIAVDLDAWAVEAIDGIAMFVRQNATVKESARALAREMLAGMLGIDE